MKENLKQKIKTLAVPYQEAFKAENKDPKFQKMVRTKRQYFDMLAELKKVRKEKGLTQEELAQLAGVPRRTISRLELGQKNTTVDTLITIASAMGRRISIDLN